MKISDFGKSGPRVVTAGLTCASATPGATAIQPAAASMTMKTLPGTLDIFALPALVLFCGSLSRRAALSRPLGSAEPPAGRARAFAPDQQRVIYLHELCRRASARESSAVTKVTVPGKRSNCHVDAKCGLPRSHLHAAETQFAHAYSRRRRLAADRQDA